MVEVGSTGARWIEATWAGGLVWRGDVLGLGLGMVMVVVVGVGVGCGLWSLDCGRGWVVGCGRGWVFGGSGVGCVL